MSLIPVRCSKILDQSVNTALVRQCESVKVFPRYGWARNAEWEQHLLLAVYKECQHGVKSKGSTVSQLITSLLEKGS